MARTLRAAAVLVVTAVAIAGLIVAVTTRDQLTQTRHQLAATKARLEVVAGIHSNSELTQVQEDLTTVTDEVRALRDRDACPPTTSVAYYERLLGAAETGTDETGAEGLIGTICPQVSAAP